MLEHRTTRAVGRAPGKASAAEPVERSLAQAATDRASGRLTEEVADACRAMGRRWVDASCAV